MADFYHKLPRFVVVGKKRYWLRTSFDVILRMLAAVEDETLTQEEKADVIAYFLIRGNPNRKNKLLAINAAVSALFPQKKKQNATHKSFDFLQDADYIYSSFYQAYGIDLIKMRGRLHWWKFQALLDGLPDTTKLSKVICIRERKLPKPTKHNAEERAQIMRLKQFYALKLTAQEREKNLQDGLRGMAQAMLAMANKNEKEN